MSKKDRRFDLYLDDMLLSIQHIEEYIKDIDYPAFKKNYMIVDAVIRNFEIIGEAANNIPQHIKDKYPDLPWKKMYGLRNLISHEYFTIDYELIWEIATKDLPKNKATLINIISAFMSGNKLNQ